MEPLLWMIVIAFSVDIGRLVAKDLMREDEMKDGLDDLWVTLGIIFIVGLVMEVCRWIYKM